MERLRPEDIELVVRGDLAALPKLAQYTHEDLRQAWARSSHPLLTAATVLSVLTALRRGQATAKEAHDWAGFLFSGYTGSVPLPLTRLDIEYDPADENRIAEVIMRLEQTEDDLDGPITDAELDRMISVVKQGS